MKIETDALKKLRNYEVCTLLGDALHNVLCEQNEHSWLIGWFGHLHTIANNKYHHNRWRRHRCLLMCLLFIDLLFSLAHSLCLHLFIYTFYTCSPLSHFQLIYRNICVFRFAAFQTKHLHMQKFPIFGLHRLEICKQFTDNQTFQPINWCELRLLSLLLFIKARKMILFTLSKFFRFFTNNFFFAMRIKNTEFCWYSTRNV